MDNIFSAPGIQDYVVNPWSRDTMASCYCSALRYVHSHCPCHKCNGKAVSRATEYRHWKEANMAHTCITYRIARKFRGLKFSRLNKFCFKLKFL